MKRSEFKKLIDQEVYVEITKKNGEQIRGKADYLSEYTDEGFLLDEHNTEHAFDLKEVKKVNY